MRHFMRRTNDRSFRSRWPSDGRENLTIRAALPAICHSFRYNSDSPKTLSFRWTVISLWRDRFLTVAARWVAIAPWGGRIADVLCCGFFPARESLQQTFPGNHIGGKLSRINSDRENCHAVMLRTGCYVFRNLPCGAPSQRSGWRAEAYNARKVQSGLWQQIRTCTCRGRWLSCCRGLTNRNIRPAVPEFKRGHCFAPACKWIGKKGIVQHGKQSSRDGMA